MEKQREEARKLLASLAADWARRRATRKEAQKSYAIHSSGKYAEDKLRDYSKAETDEATASAAYAAAEEMAATIFPDWEYMDISGVIK